MGPTLFYLAKPFVVHPAVRAEIPHENTPKRLMPIYVNANEDGINISCQTGNAIISRFPMGNVGMVRFANQNNLSDPTNDRNFVFADIKVGNDIVHVYSTHTHHSFGAKGDKIQKKHHVRSRSDMGHH